MALVHQCVVALDPSTTALGYAIGWVPFPPAVFGRNHLRDFGVITSKGKEDWRGRVLDIEQHLSKLVLKHRATILVSEIPSQRYDPTGARAATSGSLMKLAFAAGLYCGSLMKNTHEFIMVEPMTWKGQVPKEVTYDRLVARRIIRPIEIPRTDLGFNISDAVGILDWYIHTYRKEREREQE